MYTEAMEPTFEPPRSGRQAEAARNDRRILDAARAVFLADPEAPIAAVAERAGVGISALYRRYASKEALLRQLCGDGLDLYIAEAERALTAETDAWTAFVSFMRRVVEADTHSLTLRLAGTFAPTDELYRNSVRAAELTDQVLTRAKAAGVIRSDLGVPDVGLLFEQLAAVRVTDPARTSQLRQRYLELVLAALRMADAPPLPGPAPRWDEISGRWDA